MASKALIDTLIFEQLQQGDILVNQFRTIVLEAERERELVTGWIEAVLNEISGGLRLVFIARQNRIIVGYSILKPREQKISSLWVDQKFRNWGIGQKLYGMGIVNLGTSNPYTAFVSDMLEEMRPIARTYHLVLDEIGPLCVLNPGDDEPWAKPVITLQAQQKPQIQRRQQAMAPLRQKLSSYQT